MTLKDVERVRYAEIGLILASVAITSLPTGITLSDIQQLGLQHPIFQSDILQKTLLSLSQMRNALPSNDIVELLGASPFWIDYLLGANIEKRTEDYQKIEALYQQVLERTSDLLDEFRLYDPISIFAMYVYLYRNGYLSQNHQLMYSMGLKDLPGLYGADLVSGHAVCRTISSFLHDLYKKAGYSSNLLSVNTSQEVCKNLQKLCPTELQKDLKTGSLVKVIVTMTGIVKISNHMILNVQDARHNYTLDATNDGILYVKGNRFFVPEHPDLHMENKPVSLAVNRLFNKVGEGDASGKKMKEYSSLPSIDMKEYEQIYLETLRICQENREVLEYFYKENEEIYGELGGLLQKQSGFVKRKLPILPLK